jgi:hypothetical protein
LEKEEFEDTKGVINIRKSTTAEILSVRRKITNISTYFDLSI